MANYGFSGHSSIREIARTHTQYNVLLTIYIFDPPWSVTLQNIKWFMYALTSKTKNNQTRQQINLENKKSNLEHHKVNLEIPKNQP